MGRWTGEMERRKGRSNLYGRDCDCEAAGKAHEAGGQKKEGQVVSQDPDSPKSGQGGNRGKRRSAARCAHHVDHLNVKVEQLLIGAA